MVDSGSATLPPGRAAGVVLGLCAVGSVILLLNHPGGAAHSFLEVLKSEADNQGSDAAVHGGFVVAMAVEYVCFAVLAARLGLGRIAVLEAMIFTAIGFAAMTGSMILDGLVTPAVAAKYLTAPPARVEEARGLLVLISTLIRFLMPMGLGFQAAGVIGWGAALLSRDRAAKIVGAVGLAVGAGLLLALAATYSELNPIVLMAGIAAIALWNLAAGLLLALRKV